MHLGGLDMALTKIRLGDYIKRSTENNKDLTYGEELIVGVTSQGVFDNPKGNTNGVDLAPYKIVNNGAFVYNPTRLDLGSIAYRTDGLCIVSHLYMIFYLTEEGKKQIDPLYLYIYFRRAEFRREVTFRNFGSQRPEFNFKDMSDIEMLLPDMETQKKYVSIYNAMLKNQQSYERGLDDLKLLCDATVEEFRRKYPLATFGHYIKRVDERNKNKKHNNVKNVSVTKEFSEVSSKVNRDELSNYKIVKPRQISFVQTTHNEHVFCNAMNNTDEVILVTSVNEVFECDEKHLLPEYLCINFNRKEFDRYARFHSWGSARETFTWTDLMEVKIPMPPIEVQRSLAELFIAYRNRKTINEQLKAQIKDICPILIKGSIEEARKIKEA